MNYGLSTSLNDHSCECLVFGFFTQNDRSFLLKDCDNSVQASITQLQSRVKEKGQLLWHHDPNQPSILLYHCGDEKEFNELQLKKSLSDCMAQLLSHKISSALIALPEVQDNSADWQLQQMVLQVDALRYQFLDFKKRVSKPHSLELVKFYLPNANVHVIKDAHCLAEAVSYTKNLANLPANICTPTYLANQAEDLSRDYPAISCKIHGPKEIRQLEMNTFLAVAQGSDEEPRFIELHYNKSPANKNPVVLVGKGVTFDSGGISIKPAASMDEMKYDMSGAASVLGTLKACAMLDLPVHVVGLIPCTENLISGKAVKPGDIITSMSGQTVEIINTDAEGRLILCDALTYAERFNPEFVIDIATLTGAMVIALGAVYQGVMTRDDRLAELILKSANEIGDKTWRMPMDKDYEDMLESPVADMLNATFDRSAGSITAACFLSRFTEKFRWAHLDIAGTAWVSGKNRNATGRPVPLLTEILKNVSTSR